MEDRELLDHTVRIIASWAAANESSAQDLRAAIGAVHGTLRSLAAGGQDGESAPTPAVPIKKSVTPDYIICLEDGRRLKMLKRHLQTAYGMTPDQYRKKWGLPADYPMVAPNYAETRSRLARSFGLGRKPQDADAAATASGRRNRRKTAA